MEILRPVPLAPLTATARLVRPGRSVEFLEASLTGPDGEVMRASAWRLRVDPVELSPPREEAPPPGPQEGTVRDFFSTGVADVGYHTAMESASSRGHSSSSGRR